ncbi:hypothetical protein KRR40_19415 [Niabella defluvii]|nr:hypothetical protein KRR40_19415 [Niabella sp. I65]
MLSKALKGKLEINPILFFTRTTRSRGLGADPRLENLNINPFSLGAGNMPSSLFNLSDAKKNQYWPLMMKAWTRTFPMFLT